MRLKKGFVHIYTGEGKGKTSAALGLALRAAGCGCKVCIFQFFKDKKAPCSESKAIKRFGKDFKFRRFDIPHPMFKKIDIEKLRARLKKAVNEVNETLKGKEFDVIILDEILIGVSQGFIDEGSVLKIIKSRPKKSELVLTGRGATKKLINSADYVTYMKDARHPFSKGVCARRGIDF